MHQTVKSLFHLGISQGEISGGNKMLYELVSDGTITKEKAAEKAGIPVDDFVKNMMACGYTVL